MAMSPEEWLAQQSNTRAQPTLQGMSPEQFEQTVFPERGTAEGAALTATTLPYSFQEQNPQLAAAGGAILGALPIWRTGSILGGAVKGAISGGLGGVAGEVVRQETDNSNIGQLAALGAELAAGTVPNLVGEVVSRLTPAGLAATLGYNKGKFLQAITGRSEADVLARKKAFGTEFMKAGVAGEGTQNTVRKQLADDLKTRYGIVVSDAQKKASDAARTRLYDSMSLANAAKLPMYESLEFKEAMQLLKEGVDYGAVQPSTYKAIDGLLREQMSTTPQFRTRFNEKFLNTIQKSDPEFGGVKLNEKEAEVVTSILRQATDKYLAKLPNTPTLSQLKAMEKEEIVARAVDSIPVVLGSGFKGEVTEKALANIHASPEGQKAFRVALSSYMRELSPKEVLDTFNDLYPSMVKYKTLPTDELIALKRSVSEFTSKSAGKAIGEAGAVALKNSLVRSVAPSEFVQLMQSQQEAVQPLQSQQSPIPVFNM